MDMYGFFVDPMISLILPMALLFLLTTSNPIRGLLFDGTIILLVLVKWLMLPIFFNLIFFFVMIFLKFLFNFSIN